MPFDTSVYDLLFYSDYDNVFNDDLDEWKADLFELEPEYITVLPEHPVKNTIYYELEFEQDNIEKEGINLPNYVINSIMNNNKENINIINSINVLKKRIPFKIFFSQNEKEQFLGYVVDIKKVLNDSKSKTKFFLICDIGGKKYTKLNELRNYFIQTYNLNNICTMTDILYLGEDSKKYPLKNIYGMNIRSGKEKLYEDNQFVTLPKKVQYSNTNNTTSKNRKKRKRQ